MKVIVDLERCEYHGQCAIAAPEVFDLKDESTLVWEAQPDASLRDDVEAAVSIQD
jgi:ferredoxin